MNIRDMITQEFIETTDRLIRHLQEYPIEALNGNLVVYKPKPPTKTKGGLFISELESQKDSYFKGVSRVIMMPTTPFETTDGQLPLTSKIKVGDYVLFSHTARYKPQPDVINFIFDEDVEETKTIDEYEGEYSDKGNIFLVAQHEILLVRDGHSVYRQVAGV